MSGAPAVLSRLSEIGATIECRDGRLVVRAGQRPVPIALIEEARAARAELSKMLNSREDAQMSTLAKHGAKLRGNPEDAQILAFERLRGSVHLRAAPTAEQSCDIVRSWAEGWAGLDQSQAPRDVPPQRWRQFVDDVRAFLPRWAAHAAALGWRERDLFGCDRERPFARIDQNGLLWLLNGNKLIALSENTARIETRTGADLNGADLTGAELNRANLTDARMIAELSLVNLFRAQLANAELRSADLTRANLSETNLTGADLSDAYLGGAKLRDAKLSGTNLSGTNLSAADLTRAYLIGALFLTQQQLDNACGTDVKLDPPLTIKPCP